MTGLQLQLAHSFWASKSFQKTAWLVDIRADIFVHLIIEEAMFFFGITKACNQKRWHMCVCDVLLLRPDRGLLCEDLTDPITVITMIKGRVLKKRERKSSQSVAVYHLRGGRGAVRGSIHIHYLFYAQIHFHQAYSLSFFSLQLPWLVEEMQWRANPFWQQTAKGER